MKTYPCLDGQLRPVPRSSVHRTELRVGDIITIPRDHPNNYGYNYMLQITGLGEARLVFVGDYGCGSPGDLVNFGHDAASHWTKLP